MKWHGLTTLLLASCQAAALPPPAGAPSSDRPPGPPVSAYHPRDGFVVHEWGTLTSVMASDGSVLPGLHHEEEDLPAFVADRLSEGLAHPDDPTFFVDTVKQKMETPVTYFYSPAPRRVTAAVGFPRGMLTQWYPHVQAMAPPLHDLGNTVADRWSQSLDAIPPRCQPHFAGELRDGLLDWGTIDVLGTGASPPMPGPLDGTTWGFARNTAASALAVAGPDGSPQHEKFLFYRGLGTFELPVSVRFPHGDGAAEIRNHDPLEPMGALLLMTVTPSGAGFREFGPLGPLAALSAAPPEPSLTRDAFVAALKSRLAAALVGDGLYTDEAGAMVDTWERSYFLSPGVRLLYLLPQAHTERIIPLAISPAPAVLRRTMVIRVEVVTPADERAEGAWLRALATGSAPERGDARASFLALGRFAEPHLSRAVALASDAAQKAAGEALLDEVRAKRRWAPTAVD